MIVQFGSRLNELLAEAGFRPLDSDLVLRFEDYFDLLLRWNVKTNLTSIRDPEKVLRRHFAESIACARLLPDGIFTLLDFGSGAGFPGIPIALCRPEIAVTLAESQNKKAAFLREAVRTLGLKAQVHGDRAEAIETRFDLVTLRAVEHMDDAVASAARLVSDDGWLALLTTTVGQRKLCEAAGPRFCWQDPLPLPGGEYRILALAQRKSAAD